MSHSSKLVADAIARKVLHELQAADEIGGPDYPEYIDLMDRLAQVCALRANTARLQSPKLRALRWAQRNINARASIMDTGGGCDGLRIPALAGDGEYWLITDDASAPESVISDKEPYTMSLCTDDGIDRVTFFVRSLPAAANIIRAQAR